MYKIYTQSGIKETESYEEVLEAQKQGCHVETASDEFELEAIFDEEEVKEYRVLGEAFMIDVNDDGMGNCFSDADPGL